MKNILRFHSSLLFLPCCLVFATTSIKSNKPPTTHHLNQNQKTKQKEQQAFNLNDIFLLALQNNPALAAARADHQAVQEGIRSSRAPLLPQVDASANTGRKRQRFLGSNSSTSTDNVHGWSATLTQSIFNLSGLSKLKAAYAQNRVSKLTVAIEEQDLIYKTAQYYFAVLQAIDSHTAAKAHRYAVKKQLDQTTQRFKVGVLTITDLQEAKAAYDTATVTTIQTKNAIEVAKEQLKQLAGQPIPYLFRLDQSMQVTSPVPNNITEWEHATRRNNLTVQRAQETVLLRHEELRTAKYAHLPTLSGSLSYAHQTDHYRSSNSALNTTVQGKGVNDFTAQLSLNVPIFSGGTMASNQKIAAFNMDADQKRRDDIMQQAVVDVRKRFKTVKTEVTEIHALCQSIISSLSSLKSTQTGYKVGTRTIIDVLNSQSLLYNIQKQYLNSRYTFLLDNLDLKRISGTLHASDLRTLDQWLIHPNTPDIKDLTPYCKIEHKSNP